MSGRWCRLLPVHVRVEIGMHVRQQEAVAVLEVQALAHEHGNRALDRRSCTHSRLLLLSAEKTQHWLALVRFVRHAVVCVQSYIRHATIHCLHSSAIALT